MKKILLLALILLGTSIAVYAEDTVTIHRDAIYTVADGTVLKCTAKKTNGLIKEYGDNIVEYYTFKKGHLYSDNMHKTFGNPNRKAKKVLKLKINEDTITFKDRVYRWRFCCYKWVTIDRHTGEFKFHARNEHNWWCYYLRADAIGTCEIVNEQQ